MLFNNTPALFSRFLSGTINSTAAFNSFTGVATICLSTSYGIPILVSILRGRKLVKNAPFSLGKFGMIINILTIFWIVLAYVSCSKVIETHAYARLTSIT